MSGGVGVEVPQALDSVSWLTAGGRWQHSRDSELGVSSADARQCTLQQGQVSITGRACGKGVRCSEGVRAGLISGLRSGPSTGTRSGPDAAVRPCECQGGKHSKIPYTSTSRRTSP